MAFARLPSTLRCVLSVRVSSMKKWKPSKSNVSSPPFLPRWYFLYALTPCRLLISIRLFVRIRDRLPVVVDLVIIEQHERWNAAQHAANASLTQPCFVRQTVAIDFRGRIVEPGGGIDIHLVADE